jgi:hemerythrin
MVIMDLMDFLKDWTVKHIKGTDKKYQAFFKSRGVA